MIGCAYVVSRYGRFVEFITLSSSTLYSLFFREKKFHKSKKKGGVIKKLKRDRRQSNSSPSVVKCLLKLNRDYVA